MEDRDQEKQPKGVSRRDLLKWGGLSGVALSAAGLVGGLSTPVMAQTKEHQGLSPEVPPGELDKYYGFGQGARAAKSESSASPPCACSNASPSSILTAPTGMG